MANKERVKGLSELAQMALKDSKIKLYASGSKFTFKGTEAEFAEELKKVMALNNWVHQHKKWFPDVNKEVSDNPACYYIYTSMCDEGTVFDFENKTVEYCLIFL